MTKYLIKMDKVREEGESMISYADNTVVAAVDELIGLTSKLEWEGPTYDMFVELYTDKMNKIKYLASMIEAYGKFMVLVSNNYGKVNDDFKKEWEGIVVELNADRDKYL